jgi:phage-related protein
MVMERKVPLDVIFFRTSAGTEPVREWLKSLPKSDRTQIGLDIRKTQSEWPLGMPHVRPLGRGLHEVRSSLTHGIARTLFFVDDGEMVVLHGFIKKTQKTPPEALELANKRKRIYEQGQEK